MRIALIAPPWVPVPPPLYGGTETVVDRLARGFHAAGHEVLLCTTGDSTCPVPRQFVLDRSEHLRMGAVIPELRHVIHAYQAAQDYDIVHDHTLTGPIYAARFPQLTRSPPTTGRPLRNIGTKSHAKDVSAPQG